MQTAMVEETTVQKAHSKYNSFKTTIPASLVKEWQLAEKDGLVWEWKVVNNEMIMTVRKKSPS